MIIESLYRKKLNKNNKIDFSYCERKTFLSECNFLFDLVMESGMERPQYIILGFEKKMLMNKLMMQRHLK